MTLCLTITQSVPDRVPTATAGTRRKPDPFINRFDALPNDKKNPNFFSGYFQFGVVPNGRDRVVWLCTQLDLLLGLQS